jgi:hypothetical protein
MLALRVLAIAGHPTRSARSSGRHGNQPVNEAGSVGNLSLTHRWLAKYFRDPVNMRRLLYLTLTTSGR